MHDTIVPKVIFAAVFVLGLGLILNSAISGGSVATKAFAASTSTVTATVQVQSISVTVGDGTVAYGTMSAGNKEDTTTNGVNTGSGATGLDDLQTATNTSNVSADIDIIGQDATSGSGTDWTLAATNGTDQYVHKFCNDTDNDCTSDDTNYTALSTSYQTLKAGVAADAGVGFHLEIQTPSSSTDTDQKNADVTVRASAA